MAVMGVRATHLYVEDSWGPGEPILFLHGFLFDGLEDEAQVAALRDRCRCVTLDLLAVIRRLGVAPVHLVGLSMGGFVGLRVAARVPGLLRSLTLLNTSAAAHERARFPKQLALAGVARVAGVFLPVVRSGIEAEMHGEVFRTDRRRPQLAGQRAGGGYPDAARVPRRRPTKGAVRSSTS